MLMCSKSLFPSGFPTEISYALLITVMRPICRTPHIFLSKIWGFHGGDYEAYRLLEYGVAYILCEPTFRMNLSPPSSR
jgi:hypothetical protein